MILEWKGRFAIALGLSLTTAPAWADVLEIGENGSRWIAGGPSVVPAEFEPPQELDGTITVPQRAIVDPAVHTRNIPPEYVTKIHELAARFDLSPSLLEAVVWQESRWNAAAVSPAGARGLAQLMPETARYLGVDADDPSANLEGGARYLREQLDLFDGDLEKALAAYNAGPGRVIAANGVPRIRETQEYVAAIIGRLSDHSRSN